jgi:enoyl-CoA hydratase/carnithine racemase
MSESHVRFESEGPVLTITMDRPDVLNAITPQMLRELEAAVVGAGADPDLRVIVITGAGRAFSAGVDLKALGDVKLDKGAVGDLLDDPARKLIRAIRRVPKPVLARVNGHCFTGALEIMLACDLAIVVDEAKLGDTHAKWGLRPTWGMSARLPAIVGMRKAKELSFTARAFSGKDAAAMGLVNRSVPAAELDPAVKSLVDELLAASADSIAAYKTLYNEGPLDPPTRIEESRTFEIRDTEDRLGKFR